MTDKARELRRAGVDVIALSAGEPDFPTPDHVLTAAHDAAVLGDTKYPPLNGTRALKEAVQRKFLRENGLRYDLDEIMVANGSKQVMFDTLMATCGQGDEVIVPTPSWISYVDMVKFTGATPIVLECPVDGGYRVEPERLAKAINCRTKWLFLNYPNNPTGATCSRAELAAIARVLLQHPHVLVITDDVYEHIIYGDMPFVTLAQVEPGLKDRVLTVNSVSKTYAMTGWRVGYCGGPRDLIRGIESVQGQSTSGVSTISQAAAVAALDGPQDFLVERTKIYRERRDLVAALLDGIPGISCSVPEGAFYLLPDMSECLGRTTRGRSTMHGDVDFVRALLDEHQVATVPGSSYGAPSRLRISYAVQRSELVEACARIADFCRGLR